MIEIRGICGSCASERGFVPEDLLLLMATEPGAQTARLVHGCDGCGATTVREIALRLATVLTVNGVPSLEDLELEPAAVTHPENPPDGVPWALDDLIELHYLLSADDWFRALADADAVRAGREATLSPAHTD